MSDKVFRFSPSPTGKIHLGSARTAMISYILAQQSNAGFCLRIEDTDIARSTKEFEENILNSLGWLGIKHSGNVVRQSSQEKSGFYKSIAEGLVKAGLAYYCGCSKDSLQKMKMSQIQHKLPLGYTGICRDSGHNSGALRLNMAAIRLALDEHGEYGGLRHIKFEDDVYGTRNTDLRDLNDIVLLRASGEATYLLANTVDDLFAGVTNIVRGADILPQTPIQILLRTAIARTQKLPESAPRYAHVPLVLGENKEKLSKRSPSTKSILELKSAGILPTAITQFTISIGNNSISKEKAMSFSEIVKAYDSSKNAKNNVAYCEHQLLFINKLHIRNTSCEELNSLMDTSFPSNILEVCKYRVSTLIALKEDAEKVLHVLNNFDNELKVLKDKGTTADNCKEFREIYLEGSSGISLSALVDI